MNGKLSCRNRCSIQGSVSLQKETFDFNLRWVSRAVCGGCWAWDPPVKGQYFRAQWKLKPLWQTQNNALTTKAQCSLITECSLCKAQPLLSKRGIEVCLFQVQSELLYFPTHKQSIYYIKFYFKIIWALWIWLNKTLNQYQELWHSPYKSVLYKYKSHSMPKLTLGSEKFQCFLPRVLPKRGRQISRYDRFSDYWISFYRRYYVGQHIALLILLMCAIWRHRIIELEKAVKTI